MAVTVKHNIVINYILAMLPVVTIYTILTVIGVNMYVNTHPASNINLIIVLALTNIVCFAVCFSLYTILVFIKKIIIEKSKQQQTMEIQLQAELVESVRHEMGAPVTVIKLMAHLIKENKKCLVCDNKEYDEAETTVLDYIDRLSLATDQLDAILQQMSSNKRIKYSNGDTSIMKIIETVITNKNNSKLTASYSDELNILTTLAIGGKLNNGDVLNVLHNLVTNSIEAGSTKIHFTAESLDAKNVSLIIADNGGGIRNSKGDILSTKEVSKIFKPGFSTKDIHINTYKSLRGVGLYFVKHTLEQADGSISLLETSLNGTIFKIVFPVKALEPHIS